MVKPPQPPLAAVAAILRNLDPGLRLSRCWEMLGGVSAAVTGLEAERPGGERELLVLRRYGSSEVSDNPRIATTEYQLLASMHRCGVPAPRPLLADESGAILPGPCLLAEFAQGSPLTGPPAPPGFAGQLGALLARIHSSGIAPRDIAFLPDMRDVALRRLSRTRVRLDDEMSEPAIRAALAASWPPAQVNRTVVLHGDYWPGNTLWLDGRLAAIVDWENAAFGDPLSDLGNARAEMAMLFGAAAKEDLTSEYRALMPGLDVSALPHWDLYAALRPAGAVTGWGLSPPELARVRAGHAEFVQSALRHLPVTPGAASQRAR